jgi:hypothetical protein
MTTSMTLSPLRTGLALGALVAAWHLVWSVLVAAGLAQRVLDFVLWVHFIEVPARIAPFDAVLAATLVAVTFALGFVMGWVLAALWNGLKPTG